MGTVLVDDIDNTVHTDEKPVRAWRFGFGAASDRALTTYQLDLTEDNSANIETLLADYIEAAKPVAVPDYRALIRQVRTLVKSVDEVEDKEDTAALSELLLAFVEQVDLDGMETTGDGKTPKSKGSNVSAAGAVTLNTYGYVPATVRAWAMENGVKAKPKTGDAKPVGKSGRLTQNVYDEYRDAQG